MVKKGGSEVSHENHVERDALRREARTRLQNASPEKVVEQLLELMALLDRLRFVIINDTHPRAKVLLAEIVTCCERIRTACVATPPGFCEIREQLGLLFDETNPSNLWIRGVVALRGPMTDKQRFRAESTVFWEVVSVRFTTERVQARMRKQQRRLKRNRG